ncbi:MAG TPA: hypothetical protein ENG36_00790 [Lentisphaerae bacterium]|nr:hypothetical protein [Lentisphaerota bacterium]
MRQLIEAGHIYIAQPPLYRIRRKKRDEYVESDQQLTAILLELGAEEARVVDANGQEVLQGRKMLSLLKLVARYEEIERRMRRKGVDPAEYLKMPDKRGRFPHYMLVLLEGTRLVTRRFAYDEADLRTQTARLEKETGRQLELFDDGSTEKAADGGPVVKLVELYFAPELGRLVQGLQKHGFAVSALLHNENPILHLSDGDRTRPIHSLVELLEAVREVGRKGINMQPYKGVGEMNPQPLWEATINPETRKLVQVVLEDAYLADRIFSILMGDDVAERRRFIEDNALNVQNLDI